MDTIPDPRADSVEARRWRAVSSANLASFWEQLVRPRDGRWRRWPDAWAVDPASANPFPNSATLVHPLSVAGADDLTGRLIAFYGASVGGPWLLWSAWPTPDLSGWGFHPVGRPPLMVRLPGAATVPVPPELRIVEVHDAATLVDAERTVIEGYPAPELQPFHPRALWDTRILGGPLHVWVGYVGDQPVTTGMAYVDESVTGVYVIATQEDARGRGYGAAITACCLAVDPLKPVVLQASDLGQPVYRRLGFVEVAQYTLWLHSR